MSTNADMNPRTRLEQIKRRWVPAIVIPLCVIAFVALLIIGIGEFLLELNSLEGSALAIGGAVLLLIIIMLVAVYFARRVEQA